METVTLRKPIEAYGEEVKEINMRDIEGGDVIDLGQPLTFSQDGTFNFRMDVVAKYISRLAKIPANSVRQMSPQDLTACAVELATFFGE